MPLSYVNCNVRQVCKVNDKRISRRTIVGLLIALVTLGGCSGADETNAPSGELMLMFQEQEPGVEPYATRMLITQNFVRMDDGVDASDYVLFDRQLQTIYSVSHGNRTILVVHSKPVEGEPPMELEMDAKKSEHPNAPEIVGTKPVEYALTVNDTVCSKVMAVPDLLPEGVEALREFQRTLAGQHAENLPKTPVDMLDPCFVAYQVFAPVRHLQYGFPVQQWDANGTSRALVDYKQGLEVDPSLFSLPESYQRMGVGGQPVPAPQA